MTDAARSFAAPDRQRYTYVPLTIQEKPSDAISGMVSLDPAFIRRRLALAVDPVAFDRLRRRASTMATIPGFFELTQTEQVDKIRLVEKVCDVGAKITRSRISHANDPTANGTRLEGEARQKKSQHPIKIVPAREKERLQHLERLWKECGVWIDIELSAWVEKFDGEFDQDEEAIRFHKEVSGGRKIDSAEVMAAEMRHLRQKAGFCDFAVPLLLAQRDIVKALITGAKKLAGSRRFGLVNGPFQIPNADLVPGPFAVSWVRELRFYGHGLLGRPDIPGRPGKPAGFSFDGSIIDTDLLNEQTLHGTFLPVPEFMAPGASIVFEGCDTGSGAPGKEFLGAAALAFLGPEKWGYLRANRFVTTIDPVDKVRGFRDGEPVTFKWPDDFA